MPALPRSFAPSETGDPDDTKHNTRTCVGALLVGVRSRALPDNMNYFKVPGAHHTGMVAARLASYRLSVYTLTMS